MWRLNILCSLHVTPLQLHSSNAEPRPGRHLTPLCTWTAHKTPVCFWYRVNSFRKLFNANTNRREKDGLESAGAHKRGGGV